MENKIKIIFLFIFLSILIQVSTDKTFSQGTLIPINEFQQYSADKKISYLKDAIPKFIYELKLIYYITLTDKPKDLFSLWENSVKKSQISNSEETILKKQYSLLTIYTFQEKLTYIERNFATLNKQEDCPIEIKFIRSIYFLYYRFENSNEYLESKNYIEQFLLENKMIASYFINYTNLDKIQIIISSNFDQFIEIFSNELLISKIKTIRSEELKKELISKIIVKKPSFISDQLETLLMTSSNDFNSFLIYEIANNFNRFNKSERDNIKNQFQKLLQKNSSSIIHKAIYFYFSKAESSFYIEQFRAFYKKESNLLKKELIIYLLQINNLFIYKTILLTYINESDNWIKDIIFKEIAGHILEKNIPSDMALEFLKQFQQIQEDRFIKLKTSFLFYLKPDDKINQEIRFLALTSIDKNFINEIDDTFSKYLVYEKNFEIFKKAIQITINHNKKDILINFTSLITAKQIDPNDYLKLPDYYNFLCNIFLFGITESSYKNILTFYFPLLRTINEKKIQFDENKLKELYINLDGLFSKIAYSFLAYDNSTTELRLRLFSWADRYSLDIVTNILLTLETDNKLLEEYVNTIDKYHPRESIVKGLLNVVIKNASLNDKIVNILLKLIEKNKIYDPFLTNLDENISKNKNIVSLINLFFQKSSFFNYIYSVNLIFKDPNPESLNILYDLFRFILNNNSNEKNKNEIFPFLIGYPKIRPIIYKLFTDNSIEKTKKLAIIELFGEPEFSESASSLIFLLSKEDIKSSSKVIEIIGKMNNPEKFLLVKEFVEDSYDKKEIQLQFARSSISCMSHDLIPYLIRLTDYKDTEVKEAALTALGYLPASETLPVLFNEYLSSKNPDKLYSYYKNSNMELKKYWIDFLSNKIEENKFLDLVIKGVYPYKSYKFDDILLEKLLSFTSKPFYLSTVLSNIKAIPNSQTEDTLMLTPFLFISDESSYSIRFLKLISKLKNYELAHYAILSKNLETLDYFFSISGNFEQVSYVSLFDFLSKYLGNEGLKRLIPVITKYSKSIGIDNSVDFFLRVSDIDDSYKILFSLYPLYLNFENCRKILEKDFSLLPIVLKLAEDDKRIYQLFINLIFENSMNFAYKSFEYALFSCKGTLPDPLAEFTNKFINNEKREQVKQLALFYLITNIKNDFIFTDEFVNLIVTSISIDDEKHLWDIIESCQNISLLNEILDKSKLNFKIENFEILKRILYSKSSISNRNLLYTLFIKDKDMFFQYLNSINSTILDPYLLSIVIKKSEFLESTSFHIILKSIFSIKNEDKFLQSVDKSSIEEIIYDLLKKGNDKIDYQEVITSINFLIGKILDIENEDIQDKKVYQRYKYFIESLAISKISDYEKINYLNKFFEKSKIKEKDLFEILNEIEISKDIDANSISKIYLLLIFVDNCKDLSFATQKYLSYLDIFSIPENFLEIILPKLDNKALCEYIISKNPDNAILKKFIKIVPELALLKTDSFSLFSEKEIADIYFNSENIKFLYFFIENSSFPVDKLFLYAKTYEKKKKLSIDLINYSKVFPISSVNLMQMIQQIPNIKSKEIKTNDFLINYSYLINLFIYNFSNYTAIEKYNLLNIILDIMPKYLDKSKIKIDLTSFKDEDLLNFYTFILQSSYLLSEKNLVSFISNFELPIYVCFENLFNSNLDDLHEIIYQINEDKYIEFDSILFYRSVFDLLLKITQEPEILEKYIIIPIKDNFEISKIFWESVIKYRIPNLIYIFDKYFGGIKWEKIRDNYLKLFK
ncbi:MAG: hypothetical protein GYA61_05550 [Spirochaetales bacterium]|nr:hypothetical protein [Exilispira sp.]NMC67676.1 hypothetical protein [Spirochaetales bacterium]